MKETFTIRDLLAVPFFYTAIQLFKISGYIGGRFTARELLKFMENNK